MKKYLLLAFFSFGLVPAQQTNKFSVDKKYRSEINQLIKDKKIQTGLQMIKSLDPETVENQIELSEHQAPPFKEKELGKSALFAKMLKDAGVASVEVDSIGNVIGNYKGTSNKGVLVIAAHLDTVFPEGTDVKTRISNDTIYGPGVGDDNRGLAALLTVAKVFTKLKLKPQMDVVFVGDVGEEGLGDLRGTKFLFRKDGLKIDQFISVEPGSIARITNGALGSHRYKVTFTGPGGHSWGHFGLANPIHALGQAIDDFVGKADAFTKTGPRTSYNVGRIGGGTSINSIPFSAWAEVDMRSVSQERLKQIDQIFHQSMSAGLDRQNKIRRDGPALDLKIKMIGNRPSGVTNPDHPLVQRAGATALSFDIYPELSTSSTDANIPISIGIPAITLGAGGESGGSHSLHEWYFNKDGYRGIQRIFLLLVLQSGVR